MIGVRGDVLRPPHCTTPVGVKANKNKMISFKRNENIHKKEDGSYDLYVIVVRLFVCFARASFCPFSLPLGVGGWLWFVFVTLPGLFY